MPDCGRALLAYADGANDADAFAKAFGKSVDAVDASFKTFVDQRYGALRAAMGDPPRQVESDDLPGLTARAASAPGNFYSQIALGAALLKANQPAAAKAPLEKAAQLAPEASGDGSPRALLSQIAEREGDTAVSAASCGSSSLTTTPTSIRRAGSPRSRADRMRARIAISPCASSPISIRSTCRRTRSSAAG
jgi:hypothetical protein